MKLHKIILLFVFLIFINCNSNENPQAADINNPAQNNKKEIVTKDLEILNSQNYIGFPYGENIGWKPVRIPLIHELADPFYMNYRSFWIRGKFNLEAFDRFKPYAIDLGLVIAANVVYINRTLVGGLESAELDKWLRPSSYILPPNIELKENNEVYIRFITDRKYLTLLSGIVIQNQSRYLRCQKWINFLYSQLPVGFSILLMGMLIILLKNYFLYKNKRHLLYALYFFNIFLNMLVIYSPTNFLKLEMSLAILYALVPFSILLTILVFQSLYGIYFTKQNIISASILLLISIYFLTRSYYPYDIEMINQPWKYISIPLLLYYIYLIYLLNSLKPDRFKLKLIISLFAVIIILTLIHTLGVKYNIWYQYFFHIYSTPIYAAIILIHETREAGKRRVELKNIYKLFEKKNINSNQALTESAEKKIGKVIGFLNGNFTSDISREGLASAVEMNPNYMSKLFYKHTGKKISEYINHLRITDAARQLKNTYKGKRIIDIALAAGFESLSTFNRAFKNIYKITPTEYKKKYNN